MVLYGIAQKSNRDLRKKLGFFFLGNPSCHFCIIICRRDLPIPTCQELEFVPTASGFGNPSYGAVRVRIGRSLLRRRDLDGALLITRYPLFDCAIVDKNRQLTYSDLLDVARFGVGRDP